jgi:hypothetical protein
MNRGWRKGQKEKFRATMVAKKRLKEEDMKNLLAQDKPESGKVPYDLAKPAQTAVDIDRMYEFHYRRGLLTALDYIIRELR